MKIIYVLSGTTVSGGATKSFINLLKQIISVGNECLVICPDANGIFKYLQDMNVAVISLPYLFSTKPINNNYLKRIINNLRWIRRCIINHWASKKLLKICKDFHPDIIHSNTSVNNIGFIVSQKLKIPHITHIREYGESDFGYTIPLLSKQLRADNSYAIAITKDLAHYRNLSPEKSNIIYNGICNKEDIRFSNKKKKYFLYAGRIQKNKGIGDLIQSFKEFKDRTKSEIKLRIAGGIIGNEAQIYKQELDKYILTNNLHNSIDWLGERDDIANLMYEALATIVPSYNEGFGRVMPEAMTNGSLVIGRNTGGTKEQFNNGLELTKKEIGLRFNSNDELTSYLVEISNGLTEKHIEMIRNSQITVRHLYTTDNYGKQIMKFYKQIIKHK